MDLRGHGDSDATFSVYDDVAVGTDLVAFARESSRPVVLIGNSMAAGAAVVAAADAPELVAGVVLIGPFVRQVPVGKLKEWLFRALMLPPWSSASWCVYYKTLFPGRPPADLTQHRAEIRESLRKPGHARAFRATTRTSHAPAEARLDEMRAETLIVMGAKDPDFPDPAEEARIVAERVQGDVLMVPDAGHYPQAEYPEIVAPRVISFLNGLGLSGEW